MSTRVETATIGLAHGGSEDTGLGHRGPESKSIVVPYGFWLFVLSDMVLFSALFATYASLVHATDGGRSEERRVGKEWRCWGVLGRYEDHIGMVAQCVCG